MQFKIYYELDNDNNVQWVFLHKLMVDTLLSTIITSFSNFTAFLTPFLNLEKFGMLGYQKKQPAPSSRVASLFENKVIIQPWWLRSLERELITTFIYAIGGSNLRLVWRVNRSEGGNPLVANS